MTYPVLLMTHLSIHLDALQVVLLLHAPHGQLAPLMVDAAGTAAAAAVRCFSTRQQVCHPFV